jgi:hypothetical protein
MSNFLLIYEVPIAVHSCVIRRHFSGDSNHIAFSSFNTFLAFRCKFTRKENEQPGSFGAVKRLYFLLIRVLSSSPASKTFFVRRRPSLCFSYFKRLLDKIWPDYGQTCILSSLFSNSMNTLLSMIYTCGQHVVCWLEWDVSAHNHSPVASITTVSFVSVKLGSKMR